MIELMSTCKYKGAEAYVCARTWPSTAKPRSLYDVMILSTRKVVTNVEEEELEDVRDPAPGAVQRGRL